jgi:hypothetical protein
MWESTIRGARANPTVRDPSRRTALLAHGRREVRGIRGSRETNWLAQDPRTRPVASGFPSLPTRNTFSRRVRQPPVQPGARRPLPPRFGAPTWRGRSRLSARREAAQPAEPVGSYRPGARRRRGQIAQRNPPYVARPMSMPRSSRIRNARACRCRHRRREIPRPRPVVEHADLAPPLPIEPMRGELCPSGVRSVSSVPSPTGKSPHQHRRMPKSSTL